jgi:hypothetical protein
MADKSKRPSNEGSDRSERDWRARMLALLPRVDQLPMRENTLSGPATRTSLNLPDWKSDCAVLAARTGDARVATRALCDAMP